MNFRNFRFAALVILFALLQIFPAMAQQPLNGLPDPKICTFSTEPHLALQNAEFNLEILQMPITSASTIWWEYNTKFGAYEYYYQCMNRYFDVDPEKARSRLQNDLANLATYFETKEKIAEVRLYMLATVLSDIAAGEASRGNLAARFEAIKKIKTIIAGGEKLIKEYTAEKGAKSFDKEFLSALKYPLAVQMSAAGQTEQAIAVLREAVSLDERNTLAASRLANLTSPKDDNVVAAPLKVNIDRMVRMDSLSFNGDGALLLVMAADGTYREWNWRAGTIKQHGAIPLKMSRYSRIGYLPQGEGFYAIGKSYLENSLNKDEQYGEVFESWVPGHTKEILSLASDWNPIQFATEAGFIVFNTQEKTALLDPDDGAEIRTIELIYSGSFDLFGQKQTRKNLRKSGQMQTYVTSNDGSKFSIDSFPADAFVSVGEVATGKVRHILIADSQYLGQQVFSNDGQFLAASDQFTLAVHLFNYKTGKLIARLKGHADPVYENMVFSPDGTLLATWSQDKRLIFWSTKNGEKVRQLTPVEGHASDGIFSPDGTRFATSHHDGATRVWDVTSGTLIVTLYALDPAGAHSDKNLALLPDGRFATNSPDASALLLMNGKPIPADTSARANLGESVSIDLNSP